MTEETPPTPRETGSAGNQQESTPSTVAITPDTPLAGLEMASTIAGIAATKSRGMGSEVAASLIAGYTAQISNENHLLQKELRESSKELLECKENNAALNERLNSEYRIRNLRNFSLAIGTTLLGLAVELFRNKLNIYAGITGLIGASLLIFGWFSNPRRTK